MAWNIEQFRKIVKDHQMEKIDGTRVDVQSANFLVTVWDNTNEKIHEKLLAMSASQAIITCMNIVNKARK